VVFDFTLIQNIGNNRDVTIRQQKLMCPGFFTSRLNSLGPTVIKLRLVLVFCFNHQMN
jgi:hypothetical protein